MKPLIVGEAPGPNGSPDGVPVGGRCGRRLERLAGLTEGQLHELFEVTNLLRCWPGERWPTTDAATAARDLGEILAGRRVIALGQRVAHALGLADRVRGRFPILVWSEETLRSGHRATVAVVPHPSGLNRWYNDPEATQAVGAFLRAAVSGQAEMPEEVVL